jgi:DNA-binding NarL/FixJ family response regulator
VEDSNPSRHSKEMKSDPLRILIADDHPLFRQGLRHAIHSQLPCQIEEAADGNSALRLIRELKPAICVLDINMPLLDGLGVVRQMRQQHLHGEIIFLTMHKEEELFTAAMDLGVKGYVIKDSATNEIIECIHRVADGHPYVSPLLTDYLLNRHSNAKTLADVKPGVARLTPAERRILKLISEDKTSKEIADELGLSPRTRENHRTNICAKLDVHGIHSLVKFAYSNRSSL